MRYDEIGYILCAAVAPLDSVLIKYFCEACWTMGSGDAIAGYCSGERRIKPNNVTLPISFC